MESSSSSDEQENVQHPTHVIPAETDDIPVSDVDSSHDSDDQGLTAESTDNQETDNPTHLGTRLKRRVCKPRYLRDYTSSFSSEEDND